jgi:two-component system cell cycle response regulator
MFSLSSGSRWLRFAISAMAFGLALHAARAAFGFGDPGLRTLIVNWDYQAIEFIAVAVCVARAVRRQQDRLAWALMAAGLLAWSGGDLVWTVWLNNLSQPPFPSVADVLYLSMYPVMYVALMLLIRSRLRGAGASQWLDGGVVGLTLAGVAGGLILPTVLRIDNHLLIQDVVNLAYPLGDLTLLALVMVAFSLSGWRPERLWLLIGAGMATDAVGDLIFTYQSAQGTYQAGGLLDTLWPSAMALIALAAWQPAARRVTRPVSAPQTIILPVISVAVDLAVLVTASLRHTPPVAVGLATVALSLATGRAILTYLENARTLRQSARDAVTDGLSGLGNRRRLMLDLEHAVEGADVAHPLTLAFFDLNGFKQYNDTFGHAAGDALLARTGCGLRDAIGDHGEVYRLGGDEFCVLLSGRVRRDDTLIRGAAAAMTDTGAGFTVTASCGTATIPDDVTGASALLQLADQRMYAAKARTTRSETPRTRDVLVALLSERVPDRRSRFAEGHHLVRQLGEYFSMDTEQLDELVRAAELHDIGKLAVPEEILHKAGPLNESDWRFIRQHPLIGERILNVDPAMRPVARLMRATHERWDGTGYPDGLTGDAIPLGARIIAACDAYDAITSERCYRTALAPEEALLELRRCAGSHFDPAVINALCKLRSAPLTSAALSA